jgi:hypothetical protein
MPEIERSIPRNLPPDSRSRNWLRLSDHGSSDKGIYREIRVMDGIRSQGADPRFVYNRDT